SEHDDVRITLGLFQRQLDRRVSGLRMTDQRSALQSQRIDEFRDRLAAIGGERSPGTSDSPKPGWSYAMARKPARARGARLRMKTSAEEPSEAPCKRITAGPSPSSM